MAAKKKAKAAKPAKPKKTEKKTSTVKIEEVEDSKKPQEAEESGAQEEGQVEKKKEEASSSTILPPDEGSQKELVEEQEEPASDGQGKGVYIVGIVISLIIICVTAGIFYYKTQVVGVGGASEETLEESGEAMETSEPEAMEEEVVALEREEISVEVLNGSGVAGAAGGLSETLEALGYDIAEVGNADPASQNELYILEDLSEEELAILLEDVEDLLEVEEVTGTLSSDELESTARIILGK